jgi:hypothetical protein
MEYARSEDAGMTSDSDELEEQLRENLKLRRELGAEVAKAASRRAGMAYRLGRVLYLACFALAVLCVAVWIGRLFTDFAPMPFLLQLLAFGLPALLFYGLGRAFRYVLSGE